MHYAALYQTLGELRETFHRSGRLDDSNAKLDEVAKLFAAYLAFKNGELKSFPLSSSKNIIAELQAAFSTASGLKRYRLDGGLSIFGSTPSLAIRDGDEELAAQLVTLVRRGIDSASLARSSGSSFDLLNEAFGHFIRDNFRGNIEDAQYMTPPEVVDFMVSLVLHDVEKHDFAGFDKDKHWTVLDPSCGVGSFLTSMYERARGSGWLNPARLRLFGQDKVERMARLATINMQLYDVEEHRITVGNSLERGSALDSLNGTVDIILTNPPFGARFDAGYARRACGENTPFFSGFKGQPGGVGHSRFLRGKSDVSVNTDPKSKPASLDSELLFIDRNLQLLRDGGRLLVVVPDSVVSARGMPALLRSYLSSVASIKAIIALPPVTFAQAGTRTKSALLYLQKNRLPTSQAGEASNSLAGEMRASPPVFMGVSADLGFQVVARKGVQIKTPAGRNDLPAILEKYEESGKCKESLSSGKIGAARVLSSSPSCVLVPESVLLKAAWTPNHYSASRYEAVSRLAKHPDYELLPLSELVEFPDGRNTERWQEGWAFISVLHVLGEGFVDVAGAGNYAPITPGTQTEPEELLLSRINPRIPRICVTPDFGTKTLCSTEFAIMRPKSSLDVYALAYLLHTRVVQDQILSLTSGTSASHNRIRTADLGQVLIPLPRAGSPKHGELAKLTSQYRESLRALYASAAKIAEVRRLDISLFSHGEDES